MTNAISATGLVLIQEHEGFRAEPAQLPDGNWVVGHGHVRAGEPGGALNEAEAADLLVMDVAPFERLVNARVTASLSQPQFDALVSFAFSVGAEAFEQSQVLRRTNAGDMLAAGCAMDAWRKSDVSGEAVIVDALVRRRAAEKAMFLSGMTVNHAPSAFVRAKLDHAASILGAPVAYAAAPDVGSIPVAQPKAELAAVITEILKSEPQTEALLLTQVVPDDIVEDGEIATAHARPVARSLEQAREAARRAYAAQQESDAQRKHGWFGHSDVPQADRRLRTMRRRSEQKSFKLSVSFEQVGLVGLLLFGLFLMALGGWLALQSTGDAIEVAAAAAVGTPGLAATLMASFGFWPRPQRVQDEPPQGEAQPSAA